MDLRRRLARGFATAHPQEAAAVLERRPAAEGARVLRSLPPEVASGVVQKMGPSTVLRVIEKLEASEFASILAELPLDTASALLRRVSADTRELLLSALEGDISRDLRLVSESPDGTAASLMDPRAVAVPLDLTVEEAMQTLRKESQHAMYNLYVVDREGTLAGVMNLQELLRADPKDRLSNVLHPAHHRLEASADRHAVLDHPGWRSVYSLPVVDEENRFLGAVRYRTLRRLEGELQEQTTNPSVVTTAALGELFRTGIIGVVDALSGTVARSNREPPPVRRPTETLREEPADERSPED